MKRDIILILCMTLAVASFLAGFTGCNRTTGTQETPAQAQISQSPDTYKPEDELDGSQWKLITLDGKQLVPGSYISLYFRQGTFWGYAGLNTYGANYTIGSPGNLAFSNGMMTLLGGPENIMRQEQAYLKYFHDTTSYRFQDNHLEILNASNNNSLVFERLPEYPANFADLIGTVWQLALLNDEPVLKGLSITLGFDSDSQASGVAGCFTYQLPYENTLYKPEGDDLRWGIMCRRTGELPRELEYMASSYTDKIALAANYHLTKDKLEIFTARGDTLVYKPLNNTIK